MLKKVLVCIALCAVGHVFAKEETNPKGFSTPDGFRIGYVSRDVEYDQFKTQENDPYICVSTGKRCNSSTYGFDSKGQILVEGEIKDITYHMIDESKNAPCLLVYRSYENMFKKMGGGLYAVNEDHQGDRDKVFFANQNGSTVMARVNCVSNFVRLAVIRSGQYRDLLKADQMAADINKQGYVTLHVNFDTNKADIKGQDVPTLDQVVELLKKNPNLRLSVEGHTDNVGNAQANKVLSQNRSESIVRYLVGKGIAANRLQAKGLGSESPIADNRNEEGRAQNRRVELVKIK